MATKLADNRKYKSMTVEEADALFEKVAHLEIRANKVRAAYEKKIADLKLNCERELETLNMELEWAGEELCAYILANPKRFITPRQRKTEYGQYGLRSVSSLSITNATSAIADVKAQGIDAVITKESLDKKALERAIKGGASIKGVSWDKGEIASYKVTKVLEDA